MNEYAVKKALAKRGGQQNHAAPAQSVNGIPNSVLTDVFAGKRRATNEMMGHREELAPSIAAKMSQAFGMDFSAVKVYRSDAMAGTEMHGMAQGDKVVLSSDVDLNTQAGQATLGHELSHIRAQSMGMGSGRGLLNDASLEHRADSEGMLAARGMSVSGETMGMSMGLGMAGVEGLSPIGAGLGASAAAPMQASKKDKKTTIPTAAISPEQLAEVDAELGKNYSTTERKKKIWEASGKAAPQNTPDINTDQMSYNEFLDSLPWMLNDPDGDVLWQETLVNGSVLGAGDYSKHLQVNHFPKRNGQARTDQLRNAYGGQLGPNIAFSPLGGKKREISGLNPDRIKSNLEGQIGDDRKTSELVEMLHNLRPADGAWQTPEEHDQMIGRGIDTYKDMLYQQLTQLEKEFGTTLTQMDPEDVVHRMGGKKFFSYLSIMQDAGQLFQKGNGEATNELLAKLSTNQKRDNEIRRLEGYYSPVFSYLNAVLSSISVPSKSAGQVTRDAAEIYYPNLWKEHEGNINGPRMNEKQLKAYRKKHPVYQAT